MEVPSLNLISQNFPKFNHKLLLSIITTEESKLLFDILCNYCFGILIDPVSCKYCKVSFCKGCLEILRLKKLYCLCTHSEYEHFQNREIDGLKSTLYYYGLNYIEYSSIIENYMTNYKNNQEYVEPSIALNWCFADDYGKGSNNLTYFSSFNINPYHCYRFSQKNLNSIYEIIFHSRNCQTNFSKKVGRLLKFIKHHSICIRFKTLCRNDALKLKNLRIDKIYIDDCKFYFDFEIALADIIIENRNRLKIFALSSCVNKYFDSNYKNQFVVILQALSMCKKLKEVSICPKSNRRFIKPNLSGIYAYRVVIFKFLSEILFYSGKQNGIRQKRNSNFKNLNKSLEARSSAHRPKDLVVRNAYPHPFINDEKIQKEPFFIKIRVSNETLRYVTLLNRENFNSRYHLQTINNNYRLNRSEDTEINLQSIFRYTGFDLYLFNFLLKQQSITILNLDIDALKENNSDLLRKYIKSTKTLKTLYLKKSGLLCSDRIVKSLLKNQTIEELFLKDNNCFLYEEKKRQIIEKFYMEKIRLNTICINDLYIKSVERLELRGESFLCAKSNIDDIKVEQGKELLNNLIMSNLDHAKELEKQMKKLKRKPETYYPNKYRKERRSALNSKRSMKKTHTKKCKYMMN